MDPCNALPSTDHLRALDSPGMQPLVLYDGTCGLCDRSVRFILDHDPHAHFCFAPLQSALGVRLRDAHRIVGMDTLVLVEGERAWTHSGAVLRIARRLRWPWPLAYAAIVVPSPLRNLAYRAVAATRHRWLPAPVCRLASAAERARFVDVMPE